MYTTGKDVADTNFCGGEFEAIMSLTCEVGNIDRPPLLRGWWPGAATCRLSPS